MKIEFDIPQFAKWLSDQGMKKVGLQADQQDEPIGNWLRSKYSVIESHNDGVAVQLVFKNGSVSTHKLPLWARTFSADFDRWGSHQEPKSLTASRCLKIFAESLKAIKEETLKPNSEDSYFPGKDA